MSHLLQRHAYYLVNELTLSCNHSSLNTFDKREIMDATFEPAFRTK